jgi:type VI protein secretion system component Hcp
MSKYTAALCVAAVVWIVLAPSAASAAFESHLAIKGKKQGKATQSQQSVTKQHKHIGNPKYEDFKAKSDVSITKPLNKSSPSLSKGKGR